MEVVMRHPRIPRRIFLAALVIAAAHLPASSSADASYEQEAMMQRFDIAGPQGRLAASKSGAGVGLPVLFLHGDASRSSHWRLVIERLSGDMPVASFDFRGHGDSEPANDGDYGYQARAADIEAVADAFGWRKFLVVAHSGGGGAALAYAAASPERVAGLLMLDPATDPRSLPQQVRDGFVADLAGPNSLDALKAYYATIAGPNETTREIVLADAETVHPAARHGVGKALADWNPEPTLFGCAAPILIVATRIGDTPAALFRLRKDIPHRILPSDGHWPHLDMPDVVADAVRDFRAGLAGGQR
jgi:pimeloyl-ACP methyl ester carboxylesterase